MKIVKMKIKREYDGKKTHYVYPRPHYDKEKIKFLVYEKGALERGENWQYIIAGVKDEDLAQFLGASGHKVGDFTFEAFEIDRAAAIADGEKWMQQTEKITDQSKVIQILAKVARKEELTQEEMDTIDPEKPSEGIRKTKSFTESIDEALGKF